MYVFTLLNVLLLASFDSSQPEVNLNNIYGEIKEIVLCCADIVCRLGWFMWQQTPSGRTSISRATVRWEVCIWCDICPVVVGTMIDGVQNAICNFTVDQWTLNIWGFVEFCCELYERRRLSWRWLFAMSNWRRSFIFWRSSLGDNGERKDYKR